MVSGPGSLRTPVLPTIDDDEELLAGRFRRVRPLGSGGMGDMGDMGDVWLADDVELGRQVAVKRLRVDVPGAGAARGRGGRRHPAAGRRPLESRPRHPRPGLGRSLTAVPLG